MGYQRRVHGETVTYHQGENNNNNMSIIKKSDTLFNSMVKQQNEFHQQHQQQWHQLQRQMFNNTAVIDNNEKMEDNNKDERIPDSTGNKDNNRERNVEKGRPADWKEVKIEVKGKPGADRVATVGTPTKNANNKNDELFPRRRKSTLMVL